MNVKREKIEPSFKKIVDEIYKKIKNGTVCYEDMVHLLSLCDNNTKLKVGYHQPGYATYCFSDCYLFAQKFLTAREKEMVSGSYTEKEYSFMSDSQKEFEDHMRIPENKKAFYDLAETLWAVKEGKGKARH